MLKHSDAERKNAGGLPCLLLLPPKPQTGAAQVNWFQNLTIRAKVILAFGIVLAVTIVLGVFSNNRLAAVNENTTNIAGNYLVAAKGLSSVSYGATRYRQRQASYLLSETAEEKAAQANSMKVSEATFEKGWDIYN